MACGMTLLDPFMNGIPLIGGSGGVFDSVWIGHSTLLLRFPGLNVITDPVLFSSVGIDLFGTTIGIRRYTEPSIRPEELPKIDLVLLSHAHMDHTNLESLEFLTSRQPGEIDCITASFTKDVVEGLEWKSLQEMDWGEGLKVKGLEVSAFEVSHNGARYPWEGCRRAGDKKGRSYNGYLLEWDGLRIVFGGDTAHKRGFGPGKRVDVSIMPIGAYGGYIEDHCTPEEALDMVREMSSRVIMPIHFGTFVQSDEPRDEPIKRLLASSSGVLVAGEGSGYSFKI